MELDFRMHAERTPNPNSIKWVLGRPLVEGGASAHFTSAPAADVSPLARRLFDVAGVEAVFLASNFVTVTKRGDLEWTDLAQPIDEYLLGHYRLTAGGKTCAPVQPPAPVASLDPTHVGRGWRVRCAGAAPLARGREPLATGEASR